MTPSWVSLRPASAPPVVAAPGSADQGLLPPVGAGAGGHALGAAGSCPEETKLVDASVVAICATVIAVVSLAISA